MKVRPGVVICLTQDQYQDVVFSAISSVILTLLSPNEMIVQPDSRNYLRTKLITKVDRIVTVKARYVITQPGELSNSGLTEFKSRFKN